VNLLPSPPPAALRLACARALVRPPRPPFGLTAWTLAPEAGIGIVLDLPPSWPTSGFGEIDVVATQLPDPASLTSGQLVVVMPKGAPAGEWLGRLLGRRSWAAGAIRATALLSRGYARIGAGVDPASRLDLVWGYSP
jgi:hypothetical protein